MGDMIQFNFMSQNHTVTQSSFAEPCVALAGGIDSMFMPNPNNTVNPPPTMMVQVTSAGPMCKHAHRISIFSGDASIDIEY